MALGTYSELKASIASWLVRSDLTSVIPDFVTLAEADIRREVRVRAMESIATGTLTGETLAHPTRFIEARRLAIGGDVYEYVVPSLYQARVALDDTESHIFTSIGESFYILGGASGDTYSLVYTAAFAAFSADSDTNWLLTNAPDVYLNASLRHGAAYLRDTAAEQQYLTLFLAAAQRVTRQEHSAAHSGARLFVRPT